PHRRRAADRHGPGARAGGGARPVLPGLGNRVARRDAARRPRGGRARARDRRHARCERLGGGVDRRARLPSAGAEAADAPPVTAPVRDPGPALRLGAGAREAPRPRPPERPQQSNVRPLKRTALLLAGLVTIGVAASAATGSSTAPVLFDDFSYVSTAQLSAHGWIVRTKPGWPGVPGAT